MGRRLLVLLGLLLLPALATTPQELEENRLWERELRSWALTPPERAVLESLLSDARLLASLDPHKAHDALAALRAKLARGERLVAPVGNYGEVVAGKLYRGAQPSPDGLRWLAQQGMGTIVLLRQPGVEETNYPLWSRQDYIRDCQALGLRVVEMSIRDRTLPTPEQVEAFLKTVDASARPCFVHCSAGIGRTGIMAGLYLRHRGQDPARALEHNRLYQAQPEKYPDHALQAAFMMAFPLDGQPLPPIAGGGQGNPVSLGLRTGVRLDFFGQRAGAIPATSLAPQLIRQDGETFLVTGPPYPGQDPLELHPMPLLVAALRLDRLVRLEFTPDNLDLLGSLSRALPAQRKLGCLRLRELVFPGQPVPEEALTLAQLERVRAWLGPGVPIEVRCTGPLPPALGDWLTRLEGKADIVGFDSQPSAAVCAELARHSLACEVRSAQGLQGWYLEVLPQKQGGSP